MKRRPSPAGRPRAGRPSWRAVADAVGHCVLVFAFVPTLAEIPRWILFELRNPLNGVDPVVLGFVPVRAGILLLNAFAVGLVQGVVAGVIAGALMCAWWWSGHRPSTWGRRVMLGACTGALGGGLMVAGFVVFEETVTVRAAVLAFEIASGAVCGMLAAPAVARFLIEPTAGATASMAGPGPAG